MKQESRHDESIPTNLPQDTLETGEADPRLHLAEIVRAPQIAQSNACDWDDAERMIAILQQNYPQGSVGLHLQRTMRTWLEAAGKQYTSGFSPVAGKSVMKAVELATVMQTIPDAVLQSPPAQEKAATFDAQLSASGGGIRSRGEYTERIRDLLGLNTPER